MNVILEHTDQMVDEAVQEFRRITGIGASEAGAAAGLSKWQSPYGLWAYKTGEVSASQVGDAARWGLKLEPLILAEAAEQLGIPVISPHHIVASEEHPFIFASPDGYAMNAQGVLTGLVQAKSHSYFNEEYDDDEVPAEYLMQVQQELYCTGLDHGWLAVLFPRHRFELIPIERDEAMIAEIIKINARMWEMVQTNTAPEIDGHRATTDTIKRMYPKGVEDESVEVDPEILEVLHDLSRAKALVKLAEQQKTEAENKVKAALGDAEIGTIDGEVVLTWKTSEVDGHFVKPSTRRTLLPKVK